MIKQVLFCLAFLPFTVKGSAQDSFTVRALRYIDQYNRMAIAEQRRSGVPASVTLAQGVLETEAGISELVCMANNHFGIKCRSDYQGEKFFHDDDAPKECFKMYRCAEDSYKDHSDYLKRNKRYAGLFNYSQTDYAAWATGLKKCGYATNPQYAQRLIKIIEDFKLQEYTYTALDTTSTKLYTMAFKPEERKMDTVKKAEPVVVNPTKVNTMAMALAAPAPVHKLPGEDTLKKAIPAKNEPATGAFSELKKMTDSVHHILVQSDTDTRPQIAVKPITTPVVPAAKIDTPHSVPATAAIADTAKKIAVAATAEPVKPAATIVEKPEFKKPEAQPAAVAAQSAIVDSTKKITTVPVINIVDSAKTKLATVTKTDTLKPAAAIADVKTDIKYDSGKIIVVNGLKAFYAYKGELLLQYAVKYNIKYAHLLEINDLSDAPLPYNMLVYLERKLSNGTHVKHTVKEGENIFLVAQAEGMVLKRVMALNMLEPGDEPAVGATIELQNGVSHKPALRATPAPDLKNTPNLSYVKPTPADNFITVTHTKPADTVVPAIKKEIARDTYVTTIHVPADSTAAKTEPVSEPIKPTEVIKKDTVVVAIKVPPVVEDTAKDELADLKAQLDKVVYTDDSKIIPPPQQATKSIPIKISDDLIGGHGTKVKETTKKQEKVVKSTKPVKGGKNAKYYTIKKGDNFSTIARKNGVTVKQIEQLNDVDSDELRPGQSIRIK